MNEFITPGGTKPKGLFFALVFAYIWLPIICSLCSCSYRFSFRCPYRFFVCAFSSILFPTVTLFGVRNTLEK